MANMRTQLVAKLLLGSALIMGALGVYFLVARQNTAVGSVLLIVAVSDVVLAVIFSSRMR